MKSPVGLLWCRGAVADVIAIRARRREDMTGDKNV